MSVRHHGSYSALPSARLRFCYSAQPSARLRFCYSAQPSARLRRDFSLPPLTIAAVLLASSGCAPKAGQPKPPPEGPFAVSEYYAPSGAMGDGATPGNLVINQGTDCKARPDGARGNCFSFQYVNNAPYTTPVSKSTGVCNWAGLFWQYPTNNWGTETGLPIPVSKLTKVTFQVAVASGSELMTFQLGGIGTPPLPDGAPAPPSTTACPPPDSPSPTNYDLLLGSLMQTVGSDWQKLEIPIGARDPASPLPSTTLLIGAFAWSVAGNTSPLPKTVYIDDLFYE